MLTDATATAKYETSIVLRSLAWAGVAAFLSVLGALILIVPSRWILIAGSFYALIFLFFLQTFFHALTCTYLLYPWGLVKRSVFKTERIMWSFLAGWDGLWDGWTWVLRSEINAEGVAVLFWTLKGDHANRLRLSLASHLRHMAIELAKRWSEEGHDYCSGMRAKTIKMALLAGSAAAVAELARSVTPQGEVDFTFIIIALAIGVVTAAVHVSRYPLSLRVTDGRLLLKVFLSRREILFRDLIQVQAFAATKFLRLIVRSGGSPSPRSSRFANLPPVRCIVGTTRSCKTDRSTGLRRILFSVRDPAAVTL